MTTTRDATRTHGLGVTAEVSIGDTPGRRHVCQPSDMARVLTRPHPLYRRPRAAGEGRTRLIQHGWRAWVLDPPSEETL